MDNSENKMKDQQLSEGGVDWNVVIPFSEAKIYESLGQLKNAAVAYKKILGREPGNIIVRDALARVENALN